MTKYSMPFGYEGRSVKHSISSAMQRDLIQQVVTNSATQYINVSDEISPARRTYNPSTSAAGDTEAIAAKGRLVLVNGATPALTASLAVNPSELFSQRNMTYNENSIALPSDRGTLEVSGANLMYEGARVKSWMLGRDVNPAGRGDGSYYAQGAFSIGSVRPSPTTTPVGGWGNSINNDVNFGLVEKEEDQNRGYDVFISDTLISISYRSTGECPRCFSVIESPAKKGCYLYVRKWQSGQDCRTDIGCDCGWPEGRGPSGGQVDGKDVPPCGGGMSIGGTPIFNPPGADSCPGCDVPIGPPQARMPGPGIPGAPNLPGRPGIPGLGGGGGLMGGRFATKAEFYGNGVVTHSADVSFLLFALRPIPWIRLPRFKDLPRFIKVMWVILVGAGITALFWYLAAPASGLANLLISCGFGASLALLDYLTGIISNMPEDMWNQMSFNSELWLNFFIFIYWNQNFLPRNPWWPFLPWIPLFLWRGMEPSNFLYYALTSF